MLHTSPLEQAGVGDAGGMNVYVVESAKRMAESGIGVDIYTRANRSGLPEVVEIADGVKVRHLEAGPYGGITKDELPSQVCALMSSFMHQEARLASNYYELVHSHYWISGQLGWLISERLSIPLVNNMHTMAKVKNLALAEGEKAEPEIRAIGEEQVVKASSALIANTASEAASLVSLYDACPDRVFVVPPGVDLKTYKVGAGKSAARAKLLIKPETLLLAFVGRIQPHKGPDVLIRAVSEMLKHTPSLRSRLKAVIIGGASGSGQGEVEKLMGLARFLGVSEVFEFLPPVAHDDLSDWYRASDLVCVPSYSESFGLVALEAQACGTPVVATAVGGLRTAVADGISGLLVDGHDPRAWSATISRLLLEPEKRLLFSMGAIEHASHFGWDSTARGTLDVYDQVLSRGLSRSRALA
ncbi:MAG: D-inositol-3-phosphate glycosyltransferase [Actinobacteria bacterium]|nr:D-inositol-3-phosphate glycosyltransferase [Actinomycetota bacterium]NDE26723.1 D-inositol-3-phosphate glycosyltransferase [Actinomycetota bacterium]